MKTKKYSFQGTEIYSADFTKKFYFHSERGEVYHSRQTQGWKEVGEDRMVDIFVTQTVPFSVIEETVFGGKITCKKLNVTVEEFGEDDEEEGEEEN